MYINKKYIPQKTKNSMHAWVRDRTKKNWKKSQKRWGRVLHHHRSDADHVRPNRTSATGMHAVQFSSVQFSSAQFSSRWYLCAREGPYVLYPVSHAFLTTSGVIWGDEERDACMYERHSQCNASITSNSSQGSASTTSNTTTDLFTPIGSHV